MPASSSRWTRSANGLVASASASGYSWCSRQCCEVMNRAPAAPELPTIAPRVLGDVEVETFDRVVELGRPATASDSQCPRIRSPRTARRIWSLLAEVAVEGLQRDVGLLDEVLRREVLALLEHQPMGGGEQRLGVGRAPGAVPAAARALRLGAMSAGTPPTYRSVRRASARRPGSPGRSATGTRRSSARPRSRSATGAASRPATAVRAVDRRSGRPCTWIAALRVGLQVEVPRRVLRRAAHRRDDQVVVAVAAEDQRRRPRLAAASAGGGEQQGRRAVPLVADLAVGLAVAADVLVAEQRVVGVRCGRPSATSPNTTGISMTPRS